MLKLLLLFVLPGLGLAIVYCAIFCTGLRRGNGIVQSIEWSAKLVTVALLAAAIFTAVGGLDRMVDVLHGFDLWLKN